MLGTIFWRGLHWNHLATLVQDVQPHLHRVCVPLTASHVSRTYTHRIPLKWRLYFHSLFGTFAACTRIRNTILGTEDQLKQNHSTPCGVPITPVLTNKNVHLKIQKCIKLKPQIIIPDWISVPKRPVIVVFSSNDWEQWRVLFASVPMCLWRI